jgi:zinc resistance-associated protein
MGGIPADLEDDDMLKPLIAATAVLAIAGASIGYAQGGPTGSDDDRSSRYERHFRPNIDDIKAFTDARIAALKAGLTLTPDQEKNWPPFEQALRDLSKLHLRRMQERESRGEQQQPTNPFDRLQRRADAMSEFAAALKHVADTGAPLFQSLNDGQQRRFKFLAHVLRPHWMGGGGFWQEHRGFGNMRGPDRDDGGPHGAKHPDTDEDSEKL